MQPDVLDERLLPLEHAVAVRALEVGRLVLQVVLTQLARVTKALLTNLAEMPENRIYQLSIQLYQQRGSIQTHSLVWKVDPVGVDGPGGPVGQDLVAVLALHLHRLVLVHEGDVLRQVAPVGWIENVKLLNKIGTEKDT